MTDRDTKLRAVAAHFKLMGWEPTKIKCQDCAFPFDSHRTTTTHRFYKIPPPDPTDPAVRVALEDALINSGWTVSFMPEGPWIYVQISQANRRRVVRNTTLANALLDATYQLT